MGAHHSDILLGGGGGGEEGRVVGRRVLCLCYGVQYGFVFVTVCVCHVSILYNKVLVTLSVVCVVCVNNNNKCYYGYKAAYKVAYKVLI